MLGSRWATPNGGKNPETHIFVTHYHWDHIQGIPFSRRYTWKTTNFIFIAFVRNIWGETA